MAKQIRVLLAGESWISSATHYKGWDFFQSAVYETGHSFLQKALERAGMAFTHIPGHLAAENFPLTMEELQAYDVVILSDIGANTLLLHPDTWLRGQQKPNRLKLLKEWVEQKGGGLAMCGGYYSFAGIYAQAKYYRSVLEEILPVNIHTFDDRFEMPEGVIPEVVLPQHPIIQGLPRKWPALLGLNELVVKSEAELILNAGVFPLLAVQTAGKGRTLAWASDIGPHWCPTPFVSWKGYASLWVQAVHWLAGIE